MPHWLIQSLLVVFGVHLLLFGRAWLRQRTLRLAVTTVTFALLVVAFALRLGLPDVQVAGVAIWWLPRVCGWGGALLSLSLWLRERAQRDRQD